MKKRNWQNKIVAELINNYQSRVPRCRHFLHCGGCGLLDFGYKDQLKVKQEKVGELFDGSNLKVFDVKLKHEKNKLEIFGEEEFGYRTRMDFVVGEKGIGLRKKRSFDEIEFLDECFLIDNEIMQFLREVYLLGRDLGLVPYNLRSHDGEWRYLSVRINEKKELMLIIVTKGGVDKKVLKLATQMSKLKIQTNNFIIKSIYHLVNDGLGDSNFGEVKKFWGDEYLQFEIGNLKYCIGPNTFFQNNIKLMNRLVERLVKYIAPKDVVMDLYCGVGTLSFPVAKKCRLVLGIELMEESIRIAGLNKSLNGIENVNFEIADIYKKVMNNTLTFENESKISKFNVLMVDPPRKGLEKVAEKILDYNFEKIIYMSCNPLTLVKDLEILTQKWQIEDISLWDLYPQTPHVEVLVYLK